MITSVFIIAISVILFVYWLRYSCLLLLRSAQERQALAVHTDERFNVASVVERLKTEGDLDPLDAALERDYHVVTYLIEHASRSGAGIDRKQIACSRLQVDAHLVSYDSNLFAGAIPQSAGWKWLRCSAYL